MGISLVNGDNFFDEARERTRLFLIFREKGINFIQIKAQRKRRRSLELK